jgi:hypothetical protein
LKNLSKENWLTSSALEQVHALDHSSEKNDKPAKQAPVFNEGFSSIACRQYALHFHKATYQM